MENIYSNSYLVMVIFLLLGIFLPLASLWIVGPILRPHNPTKEKNTTYESGLEPTGDAMVQFNVRYYLFALLFVVFDVETVFLYPWAVAFNDLIALSTFALIEMVIFVFMLIVGLVYAWKKKVLTWG
jgi:NADH-quinone oxidoreductase subunit A